MPSLFRNPKTLPRWIEPDYFRRRRLFRGWWALLLTGFFLVAGLGLAWALGTGRTTVFQAGPVSPPHALFNHDCGKCHQGPFQTATRLWKGDAVRSVPDSACQACHLGSHHNDQTLETCVSCHREHRGHARLIGVGDSRCIECHANLKRQDGKPLRFAEQVTGFAPGQHPPFGEYRKGPLTDPSRIKFNHAVHLQEDGVLTLDEKQLEALRKQAGDPGKLRADLDLPRKREHLECASCHTPDPAGRTMQPISFEQHCKRCHALSIQIAGDWTDPKLREKTWEFAREPVPHPSPRGDTTLVRATIRDRMTRFILEVANRDLLLADKTAEPPIPGRNLEAGFSPEESWVNKHLQQTTALLFESKAGCQYCHYENKDVPRLPGSVPVYEKANIPDRWFEHSVFNHRSHRMVSCEECHPARTSEKHTDVLMPAIDNCQKCHDPRACDAARSECIECHVYHDPKQQAAARTKGNRTIQAITGK
jgi:hypothetical protein